MAEPEKKCCCCHHHEHEKEEIETIKEKTCCCHENESEQHKKEHHECDCNHHEHKEDVCSCHEHTNKDCDCHEHHHHDSKCDCRKEIEEEQTCSCCGVAKAKEHTCSCCGTHKKLNSNIKIWGLIAISAIFTILSYLNLWGDKTGVVRLLDPGLVAVIICGAPIYKGAVMNLVKKGKITSALLISVALTASLIMGVLYGLGVLHASGHHENYFFVAAEISVIMAIGEAIEDITTKKSNSAIEALIKITPKTALVLKNGEYVEVEVEDLKIGDVVMIKPNSDISVDGVVLSGISSVNQANLTGESLPVEVKEGSVVRAGTLNLDGALTVRVTALSKDNLVSKLAEYVKNAEKNKSPTVQLANKWAGYIVPSAIICSVIVFLFCLIVLALPALISLERAITILVVFCPCALGLSVPTAVAASIGCGSRNGALIKNGRAMEQLADIDLVAFDKTGTLTEGKVKVNKVVGIGLSEQKVIELSASAESSSEHVLARAVCEYAKEKGINYTPSKEVKSLIGLGVSAKIDNQTVEIANVRFASEKYGFNFDEYLSETETLSCVIVNEKIVGLIYFGDKIREDSRIAIEQLRNLCIKTCILTGDGKNVAKSVAIQTGVDEVYSQLLPEDKAKIVNQIKEQGKLVAMIGDGVNDAMALSSADCSIAMGVMGNDVAIKSSDVALMSEDMGKIPFLVKLARRMKFKMKFNITLSMIINVVSVVLSATGLLNAVLGAIVHNCSSVIVCANSALLLGFKDKK